MAIDSDPTVRAQELGEALRVLREEANLSVRTAGARIDASASKISRLENGKNAVAIDDVAALLAVYQVTGPRRRKLLDLAHEAEQRGWWQRNTLTFAERQETLMSLESRALAITSFEPIVVPGLLQTGEYTRAIMVESGIVDDQDVENRMITRLQRHSVLLRRQPPGLLAIIDELALRRVIGGRDVLRRQLEHLVEMAQRPNIAIRIVLNADRGHPGIDGGFLVIRRPEGTPVVFLANLTSSLFLEETAEIAQYEQVTRELLNHALDPAESLRYLGEQARRLDTGVPYEDHPRAADLD
ncbi:helix-turn-helix transcriptional regulator [Amycolatopsis sp.]|jgi:transcriptional regulator with XRE-family HTH domain|uniref:helix-turn-helix domain-containing protein n=1 Tax=Amycolatopsis sp. TaxID=37632 RepID=UPI002E03147B|nr:helix-turn-helix transcriptional regulator [Amycolatopsis sp.]